MAPRKAVNSTAYYKEFHGHPLPQLKKVYDVVLGPEARDDGRRGIFLIGDSSLDNKYWVEESAPAINGYEKILSPRKMVKDVCYFLNLEAQTRGRPFVAINASVEESTLGEREVNGFLEHDQFVAERLQPEDVLVCCVGGNDIALAPTFQTMLAMLGLAYLTPMSWLQGPHGWGWGMGHFKHLYHQRLQAFLDDLTSKRRPRVIIPCLVYNPCLHGQGWADRALGALNYNGRPERLHRLNELLFEQAVSQIEIEGSIVAPLNFGKVLDPFNAEDYVQRVEPSAIGGAKMAKAIMDTIEKALKLRRRGKTVD